MFVFVTVYFTVLTSVIWYKFCESSVGWYTRWMFWKSVECCWI